MTGQPQTWNPHPNSSPFHLTSLISSLMRRDRVGLGPWKDRYFLLSLRSPHLAWAVLSGVLRKVGQLELDWNPRTHVPALRGRWGLWVFLVVTPASSLVATALTCEVLWEELPQAQAGGELALLFLCFRGCPSFNSWLAVQHYPIAGSPQ